MRTLVQPGPTHPNRIDSFGGTLQQLDFPLKAGRSLTQALTERLVAAGLQAAAVSFRDVQLNPCRYVIPARAEDPVHVAYFSAPLTSTGGVRIEQANASFGWSDGQPFIHCHAVWQQTDGTRRGGHILPDESFLEADAFATAWGFAGIRLEALPDAETNFTLFQPSLVRHEKGNGVFARIKPNLDILTAVEMIAETSGMENATVTGSLGSLVGVRFDDDSGVDDLATEVLICQGLVRGGTATLDVLAVDMAGAVHQGRLKHGRNPVCITFDLVLKAA